MLRLEEASFSDSSLGSDFPKYLTKKPCSRYSKSGSYIITLNGCSEMSDRHHLEIYNIITGYSRIKIFKNELKLIRDIELVYYQDIQSGDSRRGCGDLILIENKSGEVEVYCLSNGRSLLSNCFILMGKPLRGAYAISVNAAVLIVALMTDSAIYLFSNFYYSSFEPIYPSGASQNFTTMKSADREIDDTLRYYRQIFPDFNEDLSSCCMTSLGRFYFSCSNEIFMFELPPGEMEKSSTFQIQHVYAFDNDGSIKRSTDFSIESLIPHEVFINGENFELIYIIHNDGGGVYSKDLSLLKIRSYSGTFECYFDKLSTIGGSGVCCHILTYKIFETGQLGIIWETNNQVYINVFNQFFNGLHKSSLSYNSNSSNYRLARHTQQNYRDLTSLLYGDAPLVYVDESEFSSSNQRTNEILKIHGRIFSESLKARDIEKEEEIIKNITDSIFETGNSQVHNEQGCSNSGKICRGCVAISNGSPLKYLDQIIFFGLPMFFSPVLGIRPNDNVTDLPDDWYSSMSFVIYAFACDSNGSQNIVRIIYTCWYEGIFNYLKDNLHSILKTPQMHLHALKRLTLLLPESRFSKPTSLWIALNSIKIPAEFQTLDANDINLFFSIIDLYVKNGMTKYLIDLAKNQQNNFSNILYSWSINKSLEVISFIDEIIVKNKYESLKRTFKLRDENKFLEALVRLFIMTDCKAMSNFVSSNICPFKSALNILEFLLSRSDSMDSNLNDSLFDFRRFILSLLEWKHLFGLVLSFKAYIESRNLEFPTSDLTELAIESINNLSIFEKAISEKTLTEANFEWDGILTLSLLLDTFIVRGTSIDAFPNSNNKRSGLVHKVDNLLSSLFTIKHSCHVFEKIASNSIINCEFI
ncbi:hypothetical protein OIY81_91 [Cryptosporidium canis]|uniref:Uncharacterized protein n=1 Tax=Cryptosporidium canis TaxID=195482 RepID=A0ABQ8PB62_9CRYT|nr:hypothetical protein OJ252_372 [Cryptosporidium canis]KAJ1615121.1 hypothetical protein OIY81_91 [Cryptosporidium canis]